MQLDYFKYCKEILIDLQKAIDEDDKYKIYTLIPSLLPVVAITYYCLTEDIIITRDDKNTDINTKFSLNVPASLIDKYFSYQDWINITKKMTDNKLWLLSAIRNSIMHGSSSIDIRGSLLSINNPSFKNQLECEINLNWFTNYLVSTNIRLNYISKNFDLIFVERIDQIEETRRLNELDSDYIYTNLLHFFKVSVKSKEGNNEEIPREQIMRHIFEFVFDYRRNFNNSLKSDDEFSLVNCFRKFIPKKENETIDQYNARLIKHYLKKHLKVDLENTYPNYEFEIYAVRPKSEFKDLLDEEKMNHIFETKTLERQLSYSSTWMTSELSKNIITPFEEEEFFREFIDAFLRIDSFMQPEYITDEDMKLLLSDEDEDILKGEESVLRKIKGYNSILKKTYDHAILKKIIAIDFKGLDLPIAMNLRRELSYKFDYLTYENEEILKEAKRRCPHLFEKYSVILANENALSDQDIKTLNSLPLDEIRSLNQTLNWGKEQLIKMVIYLAGINCYVLNKESIYDAESNIYDSIIDDSFKAYSKTVYEHEHRILRQSLEKIENKLQKQYNMRFSDKTPEHVIMKYNEETKNLEESKQQVEEELSKFEVKTIDDTNMVRVDKKATSTLIRNSISHPERIEVLSDLTIKLNDYDNLGKLAGVVYVPFDNLLNFFLNDAFDITLSNQNNL